MLCRRAPPGISSENNILMYIGSASLPPTSFTRLSPSLSILFSLSLSSLLFSLSFFVPTRFWWYVCVEIYAWTLDIVYILYIYKCFSFGEKELRRFGGNKRAARGTREKNREKEWEASPASHVFVFSFSRPSINKLYVADNTSFLKVKHNILVIVCYIWHRKKWLVGWNTVVIRVFLHICRVGYNRIYATENTEDYHAQIRIIYYPWKVKWGRKDWG